LLNFLFFLDIGHPPFYILIFLLDVSTFWGEDQYARLAAKALSSICTRTVIGKTKIKIKI
jgi:hypothetical protein